MAFNLSQHEIAVWTIDLPKFYDLADSYILLLSQIEKEIANRFLFPHLRNHYLISHGIMRKLIASYLDQDPTQIEIKKTSFGKPFIANQSLSFNLSHSQDYAMIAFAFEREVGIDIEYKRKEIVEDDLARSILSFSEFKKYQELSLLQKIDYFFIQWTRKEAFLKALGIGLKGDLTQIDMPTQFNDEFNNKFFEIAPYASLSHLNWLLNNFFPSSNYVASLVCQCNSFLPKVKFYHYTENLFQ